MSEKNELNDIILNKGGSNGSNKKIVLAIATLGVVLIIVVMLMSTLTPDAKDNLPQPIPLPQEEVTSNQAPKEEPLFEEVEVVKENSNNDNLDEIAQRLKQESQEKKEVVKETKKVVKTAPKPTPKKVVSTKKEAPKAKTTTSSSYYVQVGSFSKYAPNKKFLDSIVRQGYKYKFHKVTQNSKTLNKVLVGPFYTEKEARDALRTIRTNIEAGAFLTKI